MDLLEDKAIGCLTGAAVGDALGGPTEGYSPEVIRARYGGPVTGIVGPHYENWRHARPIAPYHKGDGHITDDTLMTHALVEVYAERRRHLTAYDVADGLVPLMVGGLRWIPDMEAEALIVQRVFLAEKWLVTRLLHGHVDPREAGVGNIVNCGAAMYVAPVGVVNAADPRRAYDEALDIAGAHQSSYGREAAGVFAAAVAAAMAPRATAESVVSACLELAKDGTAEAIAAVCAAARTVAGADPTVVGPALREAVLPYDTVGPEYRSPGPDARRPSRTRSIEELPVALGFVLAADGETTPALLGAVNYGRDSDSIASMAGAVTGALGGAAAVPAEWVTAVAAASRMDLAGPGRVLAGVARDVAAADLAEQRRVTQRRAELGVR